MSAATLFHAEVARFQEWVAGIPVDMRLGEWECDYSDWGPLLKAAELLLQTVPVGTWTDAMVKDFLYALARDNEAEFIACELASRSETLLLLAAQAIRSDEPDAKWQIAAQLGDLHGSAQEAEALLIHLVQDVDEYVSRRALGALGKLKSVSTEAFAERAWRTGHEYQRIAALWALKDVGSSKLCDYLRQAEEDGREYVVRNAKEILAA